MLPIEREAARLRKKQKKAAEEGQQEMQLNIEERERFQLPSGSGFIFLNNFLLLYNWFVSQIPLVRSERVSIFRLLSNAFRMWCGCWEILLLNVKKGNREKSENPFVCVFCFLRCLSRLAKGTWSSWSVIWLFIMDTTSLWSARFFVCFLLRKRSSFWRRTKRLALWLFVATLWKCEEEISHRFGKRMVFFFFFFFFF